MKIEYPNNLKKKSVSKIYNYGNRGMNLEDDINITNEYYIKKNIAIIHKKPTPIQIVKTKNGIITKAYFKEPSTTDYNGIYNAKYIDFEAKETTSKTNFPLNNIHKHQISHIKKIIEHKGIAFLIVRFTTLNKTFLIFGDDFISYIYNNEKKKSIPISYFEEKGFLINLQLNPRIDYISIINNNGGLHEKN